MAELEQQETTSQTWGSWPLVALAVGFFSLDLLAAFLLDLTNSYDFPISAILVFGLLIVQVHLIAVWTVMGTGKLVVRFPWMVLAITLSYVLLRVGAETNNGKPMPPDDQTLFAGVLLFGWLTAACWFFCYRAITGQRLVHCRQSEVGGAKFFLRHLIIATAVCGLTLAVLNWFGYPIDRAFQIDPTFIIVLAIFAIVNQLIALPTLVAAFRSSPGWWVRLLILFGTAATATAAELAGLVFLEDFYDSIPLMYAVYLTTNLTQCFALLGALLLIRGCGYELKRAQRATRNQEDEARDQADVIDPWTAVE
ncbi:hypothetical protein [Blastopirellula retiformator]|uniref:Uncharacterized protein n=1 Tax=Blastopirellula retiformator TaxID=2527970 RepID=A0A5C5VNM5_9BACT|nr:hypothetical protein [Blastopirellula retiformator]TWT39553.1 hypothetical protein Enr8_12530 [Blastopirellula retiformator]